jgi:hypothetical protein
MAETNRRAWRRARRASIRRGGIAADDITVLVSFDPQRRDLLAIGFCYLEGVIPPDEVAAVRDSVERDVWTYRIAHCKGIGVALSAQTV